MELRSGLKAAAAALCGGVIVAGCADGGDRPTVTDTQVGELQRALTEREAALRDLQQRVAFLEQRLNALAQPESPAPTPVALAAPSAPRSQAQAQAPAPPAQPPAGTSPPATGTPAPPAPGRFEVDEDAAERALERALTQTGAVLLRPGVMEVEPAFTFERDERLAPALVSVGGSTFVGSQDLRRTFYRPELTVRAGLPFDSQVEFTVPYEFHDRSTVSRVQFSNLSEDSASASGFGDLSLAFSKGLLRERGWWPDLIASVRWDSDSGDFRDGIQLGTGFNELTGSLTAVKRLDPLVFVGTIGYRTSFEKNGIDPGDEVLLSLGSVLAASPETALRFSLDQQFRRETTLRGVEVPGSDGIASSLSIGASTLLGPRTLLSLIASAGINDDAPDYVIRLSLPIRFSTPF
jgi:hypothetical protein